MKQRIRLLCLTLLTMVTGMAVAQNVAKVGDTEYATIEEAIEAWGPGKTLTLLADVTTTSTVEVEVNATKSTQGWTLNLGDYTWTANGCNAIHLFAAGGTPIHQNYGLKIYANQSGGITASGKYAVYYTNQGTCSDDRGYRPRLEINGGTYNASYVVYYGTSAYSSTANGASVFLNKSADGTEPIFNGNFGLSKCPVTVNAGYFNGTRFTVYRVSSTVDPCLYGGHFKTYSAFPVPGNDKGIVFGNYKVFVRSDASIDMTNGAPATYEAKATKTLLLSTNQGKQYNDYVYYEEADDAFKKYSSGDAEIVLSAGVTSSENKSFSSGTLTVDASADGATYNGNITLTGNSAKFIVKFPVGGGTYNVSVSSGGTLHVEESVADGIVTRTYSRIGNVADPEAKVGDTGYSTVYDAFYAIDGTTDNKTIVLQKDVTNAGIVTNGTATGGDGKTVATFDLAGHSIGIGSVASGNNADYTLTIIDSSQGKTGTVTNSDASLFILALTGVSDYSGSYTLKVQAGTWQFDPSAVNINGVIHNLVDEGYVSRDNGNGTWTVGEATYVAQIGETKYVSLAAAVSAAQANDVITMIDDDNLSLTAAGSEVTIDKPLTITGAVDESGKPKFTIFGSTNSALNNNSFNDLFLSCSTGTVTISNLKFDGFGNEISSAMGHSPVFIGSRNQNAVIENVYISNLNCEGIHINGGTFSIKDCNIDCSKTTNSIFTKGICVVNDAEGSIENTTITGVDCDDPNDTSAAIELQGSGNVDIIGCTIESETIGVATTPVGELTAGTSQVTISDCMITSHNIAVYSNGDKGALTSITSGRYSGLLKAGDNDEGFSISGGIFDDEPALAYCAEGFGPAENTDPATSETYPYTVQELPDVAQIGEDKYKSLQAAVDAAHEMTGDVTIELLEDINDYAIVHQKAGLNLTINGADKKVSGNIIVDGDGRASGTETLTIKNIKFEGDGTNFCSGTSSFVEVPSTKTTGTPYYNGKYNYAHNITVTNCSFTSTTSDLTMAAIRSTSGAGAYNVVISDCTGSNLHSLAQLTGTTGGSVTNNTITNSESFVNVNGGDGEFTVSGNTFTSAEGADGYGIRENGTSTAVITLSDNTFTATSSIVLGKGSSVTAGTIKVESGVYTGTISKTEAATSNIAISGGYFSEEFPQEYIAEELDKVCVPASDMEGYYTLGDPHYVAKIGETGYVSLEAAVAAVPTDGTETTIVMIDDETINSNAGVTIPAGKNVVLDLNGKTIKGVVQSPTSAQTILNQGTLTITDNSDEKNGTITNEVSDENAGSPGNGKNWFSNVITNNGTLTVNAGNISNTGTGGACYAIDNITNGTLCTPVLNIAGGNITAKKVAVRMFCNSTTNDNTVNVTSGNITSENAYAIQTQMANNSANKATLNISGGTLSGQYAWTDYGNKDVATQFDNAHYNITGGLFTGSLWSYATYYCGMDGFISGGLFSTAVGGDLVAPGTACVDNTDEATKANYPYTIGLADVHYYWLDNSGNIDGGGYYTIYAPFAGPDPVLMDGEFVELQKDITLTKDIVYLEECSFGDPIFKGGTFTLTFGEYNIDLNGFHFPIPDGVTILTDKQTDIFSALNPELGVVETVTETGYSYTVVPYVAQIGETKYVSLADAIAAVPTNGSEATTITMIADDEVAVDEQLTVAAGKNIVLDLNGKTVSGSSGTAKSFYFITNNGTLEITDNSTDASGKITYQSTSVDNSYSKEFVTIYNLGGTLTLTNGTVENTSGGGLAYAINNSSNAWSDDVISTFNLTGGRVSAPSGDAALRVYQNCAAGTVQSKNYVNISGGTIDATGIFVDETLYNNNIPANYSGDNIDTKINISGGTVNGLIDMKIRHPFNTLLNITGGDFTNTKMWVRKADGYVTSCGEPTAPMVTISGGKFEFAEDNTFGLAYGYAATTWTSYEKAYAISGGVFELPVDEINCAEGYIPAANTDEATKDAYPNTVSQKPYVAQIGDKQYYSLAEAIADVPTDGTQTTITMIADDAVAANETMTVATGKNIVLDLNGKTVSGSSTTSSPNFYFITNYGTLEITDNSNDASGKITYACSSPTFSNEYVTIRNEGGTLTLTNGLVENTSSGGLAYAINNRSVAPGTATLNMDGGTISAPHGDAAIRVYQSIYNSSSPYANNVNITGGTILDTGIFVDTYISSSLSDGNNAQLAINISGGTVNGLIDMKIRHPFNTTLNITGGDFTNAKMWVRKYTQEYVGKYGEPTAPMVTISGGKFEFATENTFGLAYDYAATTWTSYEKAYAISGGVFELPVDEINCAEGYIPAANTDPETKEAYPHTVKTGAYVAQIGEGEDAVKYESLAEAVQAAGASATIKMIGDETLTSNVVIGGTYGSSASQTTAINAQAITLDLNGHIITGDKTIYLAGGSLNIIGEGTIENTGTGASPVGVRYVNSTNGLDYTSKRTLTIGEDVTLKGKVYGLNIFGTNSATVANDIEVNVNGKVEGILFVLGNLTNDDNNIVINVNGSVDASGIELGDEKCKTGIALNGNAKLVVNDGASVKGETGIEVRAGELTVNGGTITATAEEYSYTANNSGTTIKGAAIAVASYDAAKDLKVTVSDGTLSGSKLIVVVDVQNDLEKVTVTVKDEFVDGADETLIPQDYKWASNNDGTSTLKPCVYVAQIGDVKYESLADAVAAVPADGTETAIEMIANEMINVVGSAITIPVNKNVVIDLNGFQVVGTAEGGSTSALITNKGSLTIKDSSDTNKDGTGTGQLISGATTTWIYEGDDNYAGSYASNTITNSGTLTIESGYVENLSTGSATYAVDNNSSGGNAILNMNGGLLKARSVAVRQFANSTTLKNEVNVAGGTVTAGYSGIWIQLPGSDATKAMKASLNVTGGTLTGGSYAFYDYSYGNSFDATQYNLSGGTFNGDIFSFGANFNITDGTYNGEVAIKQAKPSTVAVSGGKFGGDVYTYGDNASEGFITGGVYASTTYEYEGQTYDCDWLNLLADGYIPTTNTDPETKDAYPYTVKQGSFICAIGTTKYETLQDAVDAAGTAATTITLLTDAATDGVISGDGVVVPSGSNITFDLNGLTYDVAGETVGSSGTKTSGFQLLQGSNVTFKNGTLKATSPTAQMLIQNYSNLTLEDVNLDGTTLSGWAYALSNNCGTINLIGSTSITAKSGGRAFDTCKFGSYTTPTVNINTTGAITGPIEATGGKLNIENGKFNVTWVADNNYAAGDIQIKGGVFSEEPDEEYLVEGYVTTDNEDESTMTDYPYAVMSKEDAGIFELVDGEPYPCPEGHAATSVTYRRTFKSTQVNKYQAWYVPVDYVIQPEDEENFQFYKIHMIAANGSAGEVSDVTALYIYIEPVGAGTKLYANRPYVVKPLKALTDHIFTATNIDRIYAVDETSRLHEETTEFNYDFYGTYDTYGASGAHEWYAMSGGEISPNKNDQAKVGSYRWVIKVTPRDENNDYAKPSIFIVEGGVEPIATSINSTDNNTDTEVEGFYTAGGIKHDKPVKGLNIIKYTDGSIKKIYVK